jgi:hypothetical protein
MVDGPDKGKLFTVCADQACKVHKHSIYTPWQSNHRPDRETEEQREAKMTAYVKKEEPFRIEVYQACTAKITWGLGMLRELIGDSIAPGRAAGILGVMGIESFDMDRDQAMTKLRTLIAKANYDGLSEILFHSENLSAIDVNRWQYQQPKGDRSELAALCKKYKVDMAKIEQKSTKSVATQGVAPKTKPAAKKKVVKRKK